LEIIIITYEEGIVNTVVAMPKGTSWAEAILSSEPI